MKAFIAILRTALKQRLQYRAAALAGISTQLVFGLIYIMVYQAFYRYNPGTQQGMTIAQTTSYVWCAQILYRMIPWSGDGEIQAMMRDGRIAFELARPVDLYWMWFGRATAMRIAPILLNAPFMLLISGVLMPQSMRLIMDISQLPLGLASLALAVMLCATATNLLSCSYFWTISGEGINRIVPIVVSILTGNVVVLEFFPEAIRNFVRTLPFAGMLDTPLRILIGAAAPDEAVRLIALQAVWVAVMSAMGMLLMRRGVRKCMIQGG